MLQKIKSLKLTKKIWAGIIIMEILLTGALFFLHSQKEPIELNFTQDDLFYNSGENGFYLDFSNNDKFIMTPEFVLPAGLYTIEIEYARSNDLTASVELLYSDRYEPSASGRISLSDTERTSCDFRVNGSESSIYLKGRLTGDAWENDYLLIRNIKIIPSPYDMKNFLFRVIAVFLLVDVLLLLWNVRNRFLISHEVIQHFKILLLLAIFSSIPLMVNYLLPGHDLPFHLTRIEGLKAGLESGMFPVRIQPNWLNGHGYAVSVFYGDLLLYLPAILRIFSISLQTAYHFYVLLVNIMTVFLAYYCFSNMSSRKTGLICTAIYSLNIYRLVCLYTRAAIGEYTAMIFIPLVIYGMWKIYTLPEDSKEHARSWGTLSLGCCGIFLSHIITTEMTAFFILLTCLILWKKTLHKKVFLVLVKAAVATICVSLWFLVPFLDFMFCGLYFVNENYAAYRMEGRSVIFAQLFMTDYSVSGISSFFSTGASSEMPLTIGWASLLVLVGWFYFCASTNREKDEKKKEYLIVFLILLSIIMTTWLFPYSWFGSKLPMLRRIIGSIQYPWRFFTIASALCAFLLCLILQKDWIKPDVKKIFGGLLVFIALLQSLSYMSEYIDEGTVYTVYQSGNLSGFDVSNGEYLPMDSEHKADTNICINELTYDADSIQVNEWHREDYAVVVSAANISNEMKQVEVPLLFAKGYHAVTANGKQLTVSPSESFRISVSVPPDFAGSFKVKFQEPWYWRICEIISLLTLIVLIVYWRYNKRKS